MYVSHIIKITYLLTYLYIKHIIIIHSDDVIRRRIYSNHFVTVCVCTVCVC